MNPVTLFSEVSCPAENAVTVRAALERFVRETRAEPGCLVFELAQHPKEPHRFALYEVFEGQAGFDAHAAAPHVKDMFAFLQSQGAKATFDFWTLLSPLAVAK